MIALASAMVGTLSGQSVINGILSGVGVFLLFLVLSGLYQLAVAPYRLHKDLAEAYVELHNRFAGSKNPIAHLCSLPQRKNRRTGTTEWRMTVQNIGGVAGVFSAQMEPVYGAGLYWALSWLDNGSTELRIDPLRKGTLVLFSGKVENGRFIKLPLRYDPDTSSTRLVEEDELEEDMYGPKNEFRVIVTCNPPLPEPMVQVFRFWGGGMERKDGNRWHQF